MPATARPGQPRPLSTVALVAVALALPAVAAADTGRLALFADGEELAAEGFRAPQLTRDGWELRFAQVRVTIANVVAHQTEPPYDATTGEPIKSTVAVTLVDEPRTVDLLETGESGKVLVAEVEAAVGFYNALSWDLVPDQDGASLMLTGTAHRGAATVPFTLTSTTAVRHRCGEYVGEERLGMLRTDDTAALDVTFHLDHLFGRADMPAADALNTTALGFDPFAAGGTQTVALTGLHLGHVGEGHCHVGPL